MSYVQSVQYVPGQGFFITFATKDGDYVYPIAETLSVLGIQNHIREVMEWLDD